MIKSILLAIFLLVGVVFSADSCGPPQCYHPCTNAKPVVDFVFMIDVSGSMAPPIQGVKNGLASFVNGLGSNITPRYTLVIFGQSNNNGAAYIYRDATTSSSTFISDMTHWVTRTSGGVEPGLETILRALNKANRNNLDINYNVGQNNKKVFIVVTNEDSDPASSSTANLFSSNGYSQDSGWRDNKCKVATSNICPFPRSDSSISVIDTNLWNNAWQLEINAAANALIEADANVYMFVAGSRSIENDDDDCDRDVSPSQACNTKYQYCNPDRQSQNSTFGNFNAATTLNYMTADGTRGSLQDKLLTAGKIMRCFDVYDTGNSALVQNFFSEIVSDVSKCYTTCFDYICTSPTTCAPPVNRCGCDGVKYSNATYDPDGVCCVTKDCNGYCNNKYGYDDCGICTLGGANHPQCKTDCNGNQYLGFTSAPTGIKYQVQTINAAGYLLMNNDIKNAYVSTWRNVAAIQTHFHDYGVFEARSYCTFDLGAYNTDYSTSFSQSQAESDWLAKLLTTGPRNAQCAVGSRRRFPPLPTDQCGQCIINADVPPYCVKDCHNVWRGEGQQGNAYFTDNCGVCVAPGTDPNANKDSCGVCFGNDASKNECGECGGVKGNDACGQPLCENEPCNTDCDGVSRNPSTKNIDECGLCVLRESPGGAPGRDPGCIQDCAKNWYNSTSDSLYIIDECGNCVKRVDIRAPTCIQDCAGTWNGTAVYDACGQCVINGVTPHQCLVDCAGTHYTSNNPPPKSVDDCGICNTPEDANELKDVCGICTNLPGYNSAAECTPDCKGVYRLITDPNRAFTDACNVCWFANQTDMTNWHMDACGVCHVPEGPEDEDWNAGSGVVDSRGFPCSCGQIPAECSDGTITCVDSCPVYCPGTNNTVADGCGFCPGNPYYNKTDSCGLCCEGTEASPCDTALDSCGVCFGFDQDKQNPCGICDPHGTKCVQDCKGVWGGDAVVGCDGVCDSNAVCAVCGNGNIEDGETCDLGTTNGQNNNVAGSGCSPECQTESGGNVGAAIGGAIGGIAAIAALALAAFFAVRYAKKAGLIGNANKQVDFGASNSNPLYESQMKVQQNPLYESN